MYLRIVLIILKMNKIDIFDRTNLPEEDITSGIIRLFQENYPPFYPEEVRQSDLLRYQCHWQIIKQIEEGNVWIIWKDDDKVTGFLKFREEDRWLYNSEIMSNLIAWCIISKEMSARKAWIRKEIFEVYFSVLRELKDKIKKRVISIADIHVDNKISFNMCAKMGYVDNSRSQKQSSILLEKEIR